MIEDDVLDYMVMEAVALKVHREDEKARKDAERKREMREKAQELLQYT